MTTARAAWALPFLLFGSGFCALVYQTMWLRELRSVFGASTPASAAVLAVFMAGLGAGGVLFGARAERSSRPLRLYALLELGIALGAALSPVLVDLARTIYYAMGGSSSLSGPGALVARVALTAIALGAPVVLMGGTFPAMARALVLYRSREGDAVETRRPLALLYGVNTLGSVVGALAATFVLLEVYGVRNSVWLACTLNALVAIVALSIARRLPQTAPPPSPPRPSPARDAPSAPAVSSPIVPSIAVSRRAVLLAAFATGFAFLLLELVWYRLCAPLLGGSTYSFGLVLAIALLGVGVGGAAYAFLGPQRPTPARFAVTCALEACLLLAPFALGDDIARLAFHLRAMGEASFGGLVFSWSVVTAALVFPGAVVAGWQFPLLLALAGDGAENAAKDSGHVYAANTLGCITGSIAGGFGLLPALGALGAWKLAALVLVVAGAAFFVRRALFTGIARERGRALAFAALGTCALWLATFTGPTALWRHNAIGAGRGTVTASTWNDREALRMARGRALIEEHDGVESSLAFMAGHGESLIVNGKSDGATLDDPQTQIGLGMVPALLHASSTHAGTHAGANPSKSQGPTSAFVIGLGTGQTAGWLAALPGMQRVDVAEIEPRVIDFARRNGSTSFDVVNAKNVNIIVADGREALATSSNRYDLIVSEPSNPYRAGIASFYSIDFYTAAQERLAEGGVFAQWLQAYEIEPTAMQTAVATMLQVFPHAIALRLEPADLLLVGRRDDSAIDVATLRALLDEHSGVPLYRTAMERILFNTDAEGVLSRVYAGEHFLVALALGPTGNGTVVNSDDLPLLEVSFARSVGNARSQSPLDEMLTLARARGQHLPRIIDDAAHPVDWAMVEAQRARFLIADGNVQDASGFDELERSWALQATAPPSSSSSSSSSSSPIARALLDADQRAPPPNARDIVGRTIRASVRAQLGAGDVSENARELDALAAAGFASEVALIRVDDAIAHADLPRARALLEPALAALAHDPWVHQAHVMAPLQRFANAELATALAPGTTQIARSEALAVGARIAAAHFAGGHSDHARVRLAESMLRARGPDPIPQWCVAVFEAFEPHPVWTLPWLGERRDCYAAHAPARLAAAEADFDAFVAHAAVPLASVLPPG